MFAEHLPDYPAYLLRAGRRFQDEKLITITTLQSMINIYGDYSAGYFDLVITDECHRSIYGKWSGELSAIVRNTCRTPNAGADAPTFDVVTTPNAKQQRALELIQNMQP